MRPYPDNTKDWQPGDLVIHKADAKKDWMLMCVVAVQKNGKIVTRYIMPGYIWDQHRNVPISEMPSHSRNHYCQRWRNPKAELLDPADFDIEIPDEYERYWEVE